MSSRHPTALVWRSGPSLGQTDLERCIDAAGERVAGGVRVYFRADDVAVPGRRFQRMMELFAARRAPLSLAMVPAWLTPGRWRQVSAAASRLPELWCWHQHGWRHADHEPAGKKQEFGPARPAGALRFDISRGRARLESILGRHFYPVFTPPWNRCSGDALRILTELGFAAVSRSRGAQPPAPAGLPEVAVDVDLHTRRDADPGRDRSHRCRRRRHHAAPPANERPGIRVSGSAAGRARIPAGHRAGELQGSPWGEVGEDNSD
jgi:hypothetical protein